MPQVLPLSLASRRPGRIRPQLGPLRRVLSELGDPQSACPSILIVGTNGKGSTAVALEAVLEAHGVTTGLTSSPHLVRVEERIRLRGRPVDRERLEHHLERLAPFDDLTFFETITAAAFLVFADAGIDVAVLEAGMGGTWDATRLAGSAIAGITNVGGDHAHWLGSELGDRARDKGAALEAAGRAVIGADLPSELIESLGAPHAVSAADLVDVIALGEDRIRIVWDDHVLEIPAPLVGAHQVGNLQLALALARCATFEELMPELDPEALARGLAAVRWNGRLSTHRVMGRAVVADGAHNVEGAEALAVHLAAWPEKPHLLFSCLADKDVEAMAAHLIPSVGEVAVCPLADERAMPVERIAAAFPGAFRAPTLTAALNRLPDPVVAAGSLRLAGALLELAEQGVEP